MPRECLVRVEQAGDELVLHRRTGSFSGWGLFVPAWLSFWTLVCVLLVVKVGREPTLEHVLIAVPFLSSWAFVSVFSLEMFFGFERLRVGPDGLEHRTLLTGRRLVPLEEVEGFAHFRKVLDKEAGSSEQGLMVETRGRPIRFGLGLDEGERLRLVERLLEHLGALAPTLAIGHRFGEAAEPASTVEVLGPARTIPGPPSDRTIRSHAVWDGTEFVRRGTFRLTALGSITCLVLFWDGLVGVFVMQLIRRFDWGLFLFLIPFEVIGLAFFAAWLGVLLAPFGVERWVVGFGVIAARRSWLGLGRTRRFDAKELGRIELRKDAGGDTPYALGFVGRDGLDLIAMDGLTEGEARWAGGVACDVLRGCLPGDGVPAPSPRGGPATLWDREVDG